MPNDPSKSPVKTGGIPAKSTSSDVDAFLAKVAATPTRKTTGERGRLMFAMDATLSREPTWDHALQIQAEMFHETAKIGGLDVQLVWFRGFREFRASPWVSDADALARQMTGVRTRGGHTQFVRVLRHALKETAQKRVGAVVYVGDCLEEDPDATCAAAGELGLRGVPVFVFQEGNEPVAERTFREVARLTGGAFCRLGSGSARQLRELLTAVAVYAAGGRQALADLSKKKGGEIKLLSDQVTR